MRKKHSSNPIAVLLEQPGIRRVDYEDQKYYSAEDVVAALAETSQPAEHWADLKKREPRLATITERLALSPKANDAGEGEMIDAINLEGVLRLVQSIPSPKAERLKQWLIDAGVQRIEQAENPELAVIRARQEYEREGYSAQWIDKRLRGMSARQELVHEWALRGANESDQYRVLTNTIMNGAFGMDVESYRRHKGLTRTSQNLRDHMTDMELVLTMLAETTAVVLHRNHNAQGSEALEADVLDAGEIAGRTRREIERRSGHSVVSSHVYPDDSGSSDALPANHAPDGGRIGVGGEQG